MLVCSVLIISCLDTDVYTIFRPPYWCTTDLHQHDVFILSSVNFCETFRRIPGVWGGFFHWMVFDLFFYCVTVKTICRALLWASTDAFVVIKCVPSLPKLLTSSGQPSIKAPIKWMNCWYRDFQLNLFIIHRSWLNYNWFLKAMINILQIVIKLYFASTWPLI